MWLRTQPFSNRTECVCHGELLVCSASADGLYPPFLLIFQKTANGKPPVDHKAFTDSKGPLNAEHHKAPAKAPSKVTVSRGHTDVNAHVEPKPDEAIQKSHAEAVNHDQ